MKQQILVFNDVYHEPASRSQADAEKVNAFGWAAKVKIWDRPKETDITLVSSEKRYEPFWNIKASRHVKFEYNTTYTVHAKNPFALHTTLLDKTLVFPGSKAVELNAVEYCGNRVELSEFFNGLKKSGTGKSPVEYLAKYKFEPLDNTSHLTTIPPEIPAAFIAQEVKKRLMEPVDASTILDDALVIQELLLYYRPVYAFEYAWRDKRGVVEIDALTGHVNREGSMLASLAKGMMTHDTIFDVGAELANALIPGGGVVVKLVGAAAREAAK